MNDTAAGAGDLKTGGDTDELDPEPGHLAELPRSLAMVTTAREGNAVEHQLLISPGVTAADVTAAMILMPPAAALVGHRGAGDVALVFREPAGASRRRGTLVRRLGHAPRRPRPGRRPGVSSPVRARPVGPATQGNRSYGGCGQYRGRVAVLTLRSDDFPRWYQDVIAKAELADNGPVRGTMVIRPYGYSLWERMQAEVDARIKAAGAENAYFPLLIPESYLRPRGRPRRGLQPGAGGRHPRRRQGAGGARRRPADQRDGHRRVHGEVDAELPRSAAAAQPVGERRPLGAAARGCSCAPASSSGRRATPRTSTEADAPRYARKIPLEVYQDFMVNVLAMPVFVGPQDPQGALRRCDQHPHLRGHDGRRQGAADGHQPRARPELRPRLRHRLPRPTAPPAAAGRPRGARPPGWSAA